MRRWAVRLGLVVGSWVALVLSAEVVLRVFNPLRLDWRMVEHHPVRIETLSPNDDSLFGDIRVKTNEFGHRVPTTWAKRYDQAKPRGVKRILMSGDSFTFGDEWPAEASFVEQLQQRPDPIFSKDVKKGLLITRFSRSYVALAALEFSLPAGVRTG